MRLRPWHMGLAGLVTVALLLGIWGITARRSVPERPHLSEAASATAGNSTSLMADPQASSTETAQITAVKQAIHLYFVAADGRHLVSETRMVMRPVDPIAFGRLIVLALLEGPKTPTGRSLPEETQLRAFFIGEDGTAYVDLSEAVSRQHPGGVTLERLTIYSLVNSLVINSDTIKTVRVLIEGREAETLAGHIDLQRAFNANLLLIK
ncbi:MAG: GerMN domain-containing protein [Desulfosarcinaceae bacterium]|nr:GerMN domain-containing protein [Desulfosarcinaceae bacterium]